MSYPNPSTALASIVVDELARGGVRLVTAAPGSRSTSLVMAVAARDDIELVICIDERSAAFHALGWVKAAGYPAAVITTSGTAAANLMPAVVEADLAGVPLVALTSDRPSELRGVGANQTITQRGLFGQYVRAEHDLGPAESHPDAPRWWRSIVAQSLGMGKGFGGRPGPVHVNLAFREPTVPVADDGRSRAEPYPHDHPGRADGAPWTEAIPATGLAPGTHLETLLAEIETSSRGVIVAGSAGEAGRAAARLGSHLGWPVLATAESGLRRRGDVLATGHHLAGRAEPDLVIRFGGPGPSRRMVELVCQPVFQAVVSPAWSDPGRHADLVIAGTAAAVVERLEESILGRVEDEWLSWWRTADAAVREALVPELETGLTEPAIAWSLGQVDSDLLVVASSMPIRDVEGYAFAAPPLVANRGASGIDGFVSTALGAARTGGTTAALTGDLSLLHDANGFLSEDPPPCVFVVVDNGGGGIFSFLPQAAHAADDFERLFAAPHRRDLAGFAAWHGLGHQRLQDVSDLPGAVKAAWSRGGVSLVVAETNRDENVAEHSRLDRIATQALSEIPPI